MIESIITVATAGLTLLGIGVAVKHALKDEVLPVPGPEPEPEPQSEEEQEELEEELQEELDTEDSVEDRPTVIKELFETITEESDARKFLESMEDTTEDVISDNAVILVRSENKAKVHYPSCRHASAIRKPVYEKISEDNWDFTPCAQCKPHDELRKYEK